ncbi:MAG: hypothetical protein ABII27_01955 [bacterium]
MKKKLLIKLIASFCLLLIFLYPVYAGHTGGDYGVGLNYPGLGVRYYLSNNFSLEGKGQFEKDIVLGGLRGYYYFNHEAEILFFTGLEADFISFKGDDSKGSGFAGEIFIGGETFIANSLSLQLDFGPAFISLKDKDTSIKADGVELVVNFGVNYYFGK